MRKINECFDKQLTAIHQKITQLEQLNILVNELLPVSLQKYCQVTQFNQGRLNIGISEVALATELRFYLPTLRDLLRKQAKLHQLASLSISIITSSPIATKKQTTKQKTLSPTAQLAIAAASESSHYEPLQQAWKEMIKK